MIENIGNSSTIRINFTIDEIGHALSRESQINLFRIIQEAVSNIVRHSGATNATIDIKANPSHIFITILDDGRGFDSKRIGAGTGGRLGFGLSGMAERARLLGGTLNIRSGPGAGTALESKLPINRL